MSAFARMATVSCSTKRPPAISDGKRGAPAESVTGLLCTPVDPVDPETSYRLQIETPHTLLQTFVAGDPDIKRGDVLVVGSAEYPIRAVSDWAWKSDVFVHLILEDLDD